MGRINFKKSLPLFILVIGIFLMPNFVEAQIAPLLGTAQGPTILPGSNAHGTIGARYIYQDVD